MTGVICVGIAIFYMNNNMYENIYNVTKRFNRDYNDNKHNMHNNNMNNNNQYTNRHDSRQQMDVNDYFLPGVAGPGGAAGAGVGGGRGGGARRGG